MTTILLLPASLLLAQLAAPAPPIVALTVTPDGQQIVAGSQAGVQIVSLPDLERKDAASRRVLPSELEQVHDLAFGPSGGLLAVAGGSPGEKGGVELWSWPEAKLIKQFRAGGDVIYRVAWNAEGDVLAIAGGDKRIRRQPIDGSEPSALECHSAAALAVTWLTADKLIVSAGVDQSLRVLDPKLSGVVRSLENHTAAVRDLAVRPGEHDGPALVASASADRTVRFWQPAIGRLVRFVRLSSAATALCWTPGGSHVLAACEDGRLRAIDPETLAAVELAQSGPLAPRVGDPAGDLAPGGPPASSTRGASGPLCAVAALPDGKSAVVGGERGQLQIVPLDAINP